MLNVAASEYFTDLELFKMFRAEPNSVIPQWVFNVREEMEKETEALPGEPGTVERIEYYRQLAENELPLS